MLRLSRNTIRMRVFSLNPLLQNLATRHPISAVPGARFFIRNGYLKKWAGKRPRGTLRVTVEKIVWAPLTLLLLLFGAVVEACAGMQQELR